MSAPDLALLTEGLDPARGGAERAIRALTAALIRDGVSVAVYTPADRSGPGLPPPARMVHVSVSPGPRPLWAWEAARAMGVAARADGAKQIVACGKLLGADAYWPHGGLQSVSRRASSRAGRGLGRRLLARLGRTLRVTEWVYDRVEAQVMDGLRRGEIRGLALSERVRDDMAQRGGVAPSSIAVVRNGVDAERFAPPTEAARRAAKAALAVRLGAKGDAPVALFCAHAFRLKGLDVAIKATARAPGVHLAVAGQGARGPYEGLAKEVGLAGRLSFLGRVGDMPDLYHGASFLLHPSRYDPCSLVVLEALASGLPVLASAEDGASELVLHGESGYVVADSEDWLAYAAHAQRLSDPRVRADFAGCAATFQRGWSDVARELLSALRD